ncbi:hypothetical protein [Agreia sp. COWG]|uniref:hypothetical protein n=1 Tax=Agreia sp. COWG TaxID=2773266 RepID=UPI00192828B2|nr:hypothetical protein [Agreia sp. COWG]
MSDISETIGARRRLKRMSDIRDIFVYVMGAAVGLCVLSLVRLLAGQDEVFPTVIIPLLVLVGVIGNVLTRRRYDEALNDLELAARNVVRSEVHDREGGHSSI